MTSLLFDTSVLICHLRGEHPGCTRYVDQVAGGKLGGVIAAISAGELYAGESLDARGEAMLEALMSAFAVIPADQAVCIEAGRLVRQFRRSHGMGMIDAIIAATALSVDCPLLTLNARHFHFIPGVLVINPLIGTGPA